MSIRVFFKNFFLLLILPGILGLIVKILLQIKWVQSKLAFMTDHYITWFFFGVIALLVLRRLSVFKKWHKIWIYVLCLLLSVIVILVFPTIMKNEDIKTVWILLALVFTGFIFFFKKEKDQHFDLPKDIISSDGDKLERKEIAGNIYRDILDDKISHTYGILGEWGSGKTCLMKFINEEIEKSKKETKVFSAYLDALEANSDEEFVAMILKIIKETIKQNYFLYSNFDELSFNHYIKKVRKFYVEGVTFNLLSLASVRIASRACIEDIKRMKKTINSLLEQFDFRNIVIFIDNLDRCSSVNIIKMIESFKYFVGLDKIKFVISIDEDIIFDVFKKEYGNLEENKKYGFLFKWIDKTYKLIESHSNIAKKYFYELSGVNPHEYIDTIIENVHFNPRIFDKIIGKINVVNRLDITSIDEVTIVAVFIKHYDPGFFEIIVKIDTVNSLWNKMAELEKEARLGYKLLRPIYLNVMRIYEDGKIEKAPQQKKKTIKEDYDTRVYQSFLMPFKNLSEY